MEPVPNFLLDNTRFHHINSVVCGMRSNLYKVNIYITVRFFLKNDYYEFRDCFQEVILH